MALGEYISVSSQRDSERVLLAKESRELQRMPGTELTELTAIYEAKGLSPQTAAQVAEELTAHDALAAHVEAELNIDPEDLANPWQAARASARHLAFTYPQSKGPRKDWHLNHPLSRLRATKLSC